MARRKRGTNQRVWDVGRVEVNVDQREVVAVTLIDSDERRFFEVESGTPWREVAVLALESRFRAVGWWAIPTVLRIDDEELLWSIRENDFLDDCEIVVVDGLISMRWAARALEKMLDGSAEFSREALRLAA